MTEDKEQFRSFKGIWIPRIIWLADDLSITEKVFLAEINSLDNNDGCFASNSYFSDFFKLSPQRASQIVNGLIKKKLLSVVYERSGKQIKKRVLRILDTRYKEYLQGGAKQAYQGYQENAKEITNYISNHDNKERVPVLTSLHLTVEAFLNKWEEWETHRRELRKKLTISTRNKQLKMLDKYPVEVACQMLENSIRNGWTGIFELKTNTGKAKVQKILEKYS